MARTLLHAADTLTRTPLSQRQYELDEKLLNCFVLLFIKLVE